MTDAGRISFESDPEQYAAAWERIAAETACPECGAWGGTLEIETLLAWDDIPVKELRRFTCATCQHVRFLR